MAKQKTIFTRIIRKVKQDAGSTWTRQYITSLENADIPFASLIPEDAHTLHGDGFIRTLQAEALIRLVDENRNGTSDNGEVPIYPGLMSAWESAPATVEFDADAVEYAAKNLVTLLDIPLKRINKLFPSCLLCDVRPFGLERYGMNIEGLFIYPTYDLDRQYCLLLVIAVSLKKGLRFPLESKIILKGETLLDALDFSWTERDICEERCWAGLDDGSHEAIFSALDDEPDACDLAAKVLALMCCDATKVVELPGSRERRLMVELRGEGVAVAEPEELAAPSPANEGLNALAGDAAPDSSEPELEPVPRNCAASSPVSDDTAAEETGVETEVGAGEERATQVGGTARDAAESASAEEDMLDAEAGAAAEAGATAEPSSEDDALGAQDASLSPAGSDADDDADTLALIAELQAQVASLEAALADQERKSSSLEYHLGQAQAAANQAKSEAAALCKRAELAESMDIPTTPLEALELAERAFSDRLIFMDQARRGAEAFTKGSAREVWAVLRSMAVVLHPLIFGKAGGNIARAFEAQSGFEITFREMKMIKSAAAYSKMRTVTTDNGEQKKAMAHVKGKGTKKGESLRVHFYADYAAKALVIAHCGEHLPTYDTSSL